MSPIVDFKVSMTHAQAWQSGTIQPTSQQREKYIYVAFDKMFVCELNLTCLWHFQKMKWVNGKDALFE